MATSPPGAWLAWLPTFLHLHVVHLSLKFELYNAIGFGNTIIKVTDLTPGVMGHRYSPFWEHGITEEVLGFEPNGVQVKTPASPLPMSLTWGCQQLVRLGFAVVIFFFF
jgi:hypothetical protein